jgi:hypothetical protein
MYIYIYLSGHLWKLADVIMEAMKSHDLPFARWRTRNA